MSKDEISVMKLVGASPKYVKGPFVVGGILCGFISSLIIIFLGGIFTFWLSSRYSVYFSGFDLFDYYLTNFLSIILIIFGSGIVLGSISSYMAVQKYLKN